MGVARASHVVGDPVYSEWPCVTRHLVVSSCPMASVWQCDFKTVVFLVEIATELDSLLVLPAVLFMLLYGVPVSWTVRESALQHLWWDKIGFVPGKAAFSWVLRSCDDVPACSIHLRMRKCGWSTSGIQPL